MIARGESNEDPAPWTWVMMSSPHLSFSKVNPRMSACSLIRYDCVAPESTNAIVSKLADDEVSLTLTTGNLTCLTRPVFESLYL